MNNLQRTHFKKGIMDGLPIALGYLAVSFSLGISARESGLSIAESSVSSFAIFASAGQYGAYQVIAQHGTIFEAMVVALITNSRYLLQSFALNQQIDPQVSLRTRLPLGLYISDEIFAVAMTKEKYVSPHYIFGLMFIGVPAWTVGIALGNLIGNLLPDNIVSALNVALYGMFLAVIMPATKNNLFMTLLIGASFACSYLIQWTPIHVIMSDSMVVILLTVVISCVAAYIKPVKVKEEIIHD